MKFLLIASAVVLAAARPQEQDSGLIRSESSQDENGSFRYAFETTDPISVDAAGEPKLIGEDVGIVMRGSYSYIAKDADGNDVPVQVDWTADEEGFNAISDAIPVAPVDPNAEAQAAAYAAAPVTL